MISSYEIRENSLTSNSVFILLVKGDEEGCEDVLEEFKDICKQIDATIDGFDYVFELSGITDDYMLEKIKGRMEFISSSVLGVSQTFGNKDETETISIDKTMQSSKGPLSIAKDTKNNHMRGKKEENSQKDALADVEASGFFVTNEHKDEVDFKDIKTNSNLISGDEKKISIQEDTSLRLVRTVPNLKEENKLSSMNQNNNQEEKRVEENLSKVEQENQTIHPYSQEEIEGVFIEKEKTGLFGNIFGKIKFAIKSKNDKHTNQNNMSKKGVKNSSLFNKENKMESIQVNSPKKEIKTEEKPKVNPFQDLGEGIIVKKGILSEEVPASTEKQELATNSVTAKLQVDDIFAAETICDFYGNQPDFQQQENNTVFKKQETPLEKLEKISEVKTSTIDEVFSEKESVSETLFEEEKQEEPENNKPLQNTGNTQTGTVTFPEQIFTKGDVKREQTIISPKKGNLPKLRKTEQEKNSLLNSEENQKISSKIQKEKKIENMTEVEEQKKNSLPGLEELRITKVIPSNKEENKPTIKEKEKNSLPSLEEFGKKQQKPISKETGTKIDNSFGAEKTNQQDKQIKKGEKNMPEQNHENKVISNSKEKDTLQSKVANMKSVAVKRREKIDHTLHIAAPAKDVKYRNYPIEMPLIPTYTFANMDISAIRFSHAMAMATLDDLGKSNNPFLIQGTSGTGKTHFLHALGYEISKRIPQSKILFTNGVRFSRGVQYLLEKGQEEKLDAFFNNAEVLIIDDVHLTAVNENNREYISKILNEFLKNKKQIILSSKYPPESLKRFEELVNFKFSLGTITELKVPNKVHFAKLTNKIVTASFLDLTEQQVQAYFCDQSNSLGDVARNVKRVKVLSRMIESSGIKKLSYEEILKEMTAINGENSESEIIKKDFEEITALERNKESSWGNFGFFFPVSNIDKFRWVAFAFQEAAKELGIKGGFNYALKSAYSTEHIISAAFKIANICDLKGLKGAIILGPSPLECKEPIRDNFYDILTHMLEVMMIRCGTINFEDIKKPSAYIKMLGDILR